jgi:hypothetical protein
MKFLFKLMALLILTTIVAVPVVMFFYGIDEAPMVREHITLSYDNVNRVKKIIEKSKPTRMWVRQVRDFTVSEKDLNLMAGYGIDQAINIRDLFVNIDLGENDLDILTTITIPPTPSGDYLNLKIGLAVNENTMAVDHVHVGKIMIPGLILKPLLAVLDKSLLKNTVYQQIKENSQSIKTITIKDDMLKIAYDWNPKSMAKLQESGKELLIPSREQQRLIAYTSHLGKILLPYENKKISVAKILGPMFLFAGERSGITGLHQEENKAMIQAVAVYSINRSIKDIVQKKYHDEIPGLPRTYLTLKGRGDLAKHFLVSAGFAVSAGSSFANFIGLAKEVDDSDGGSGFSFADLAADRAGVQLGETAVLDSGSAKQLMQKMSSDLKESYFMPEIDQLPENIMKAEFKKKYQDLDSKTYALVNDEITRRIRECLIYQ